MVRPRTSRGSRREGSNLRSVRQNDILTFRRRREHSSDGDSESSDSDSTRLPNRRLRSVSHTVLCNISRSESCIILSFYSSIPLLFKTWATLIFVFIDILFSATNFISTTIRYTFKCKYCFYLKLFNILSAYNSNKSISSCNLDWF